MKIKLLFVFLFLSAGVFVFAQQKDTSKVSNDTTYWDNDEEWQNWEKDWDKEWNNWEAEFGHFSFKGTPAISVNYGFPKMTMKGLSSTFAKPGNIEIRLGYASERTLRNHEGLLDYSNHFFHVGNINSDLGNASAKELSSNNWRFGFGSLSGYGYKFGSSGLLLNHGFSIDWTKVDVKGIPATAADVQKLEMYNKDFRFGTSWTGNMEIKIIPQLAVDASYERSAVFERHLFWKWAGSVVVETAGQVLIDQFVGEIVNSSPYAAPVVNFILKNAFSYGFYELRKDKMNWPFETDAPLMIDQFKVGMTFVF